MPEGTDTRECPGAVGVWPAGTVGVTPVFRVSAGLLPRARHWAPAGLVGFPGGKGCQPTPGDGTVISV